MLPVRMTEKQKAMWIAWGQRLFCFSLGVIVAGGKNAVVLLALGVALWYVGAKAIVVVEKPEDAPE